MHFLGARGIYDNRYTKNKRLRGGVLKTLIRNGKIYIESGVFHDYMILEDGFILETGTGEPQIEADEVKDLEGRTVIPGLNDNHLHLFTLGDQGMTLRLQDATSIEEIIQRGKDYLKDHPETTFLFGVGWNQDYLEDGRMPTREDLDQISTEIPVMLERVCIHIATINTKLMEMMGIDKDTEIQGGTIGKDEQGEINGILEEAAKFSAIALKPTFTDQDIEDRLLWGIRHAVKSGLTSIGSCDIMDGSVSYERMFPILKKLSESGQMPLRYYGQFNITDPEELKRYLETYYHDDAHYSDRFYKGALKLFADGSLGARTALLLEPYSDDPSTKGVVFLSREQLKELHDIAHHQGVRVLTHSIGDGAITNTIDTIVSLDEKNEMRHGIVHYQITNEAIWERVKEHNIPVLLQPCFLNYDIDMAPKRVGPERARVSYAFNSNYQNYPLGTSFGTDCPVEDLNPFENIYFAVTRQNLKGDPAEGYFPEERMSVEDAIDAYTISTSFGEGHEEIKGRLKKGYVADFVVLSDDIFTIEPSKIKDLYAVESYVGGESIYQREA